MYKRQVYPQMLDYLKRADVISVQIGSNDALVPALVAPVSYTHLDVYKRQGRTCSA